MFYIGGLDHLTNFLFLAIHSKYSCLLYYFINQPLWTLSSSNNLLETPSNQPWHLFFRTDDITHTQTIDANSRCHLIFCLSQLLKSQLMYKIKEGRCFWELDGNLNYCFDATGSLCFFWVFLSDFFLIFLRLIYTVVHVKL